MKHFPAFLSLVPGLGHIYLGRCLKGVFLFVLFALLVDASYMVPFLFPEQARFTKGALAAAAIVWLFSIAEIVRLTYLPQNEWKAKRKKELFATGVQQYLRSEYEPAKETFSKVLKLNRYDPDAHFYLGMVHKAMGNAAKSKRHMLKAVETDESKKWALEIDKVMKGA